MYPDFLRRLNSPKGTTMTPTVPPPPHKPIRFIVNSSVDPEHTGGNAAIAAAGRTIYDMSVETLNCAGYDHNWVRNYRYDENYAPLIPKGTILHTISWFDGTRKNANLADPRNTTVFGRRSIQNMLGLNNWVYYLTDEQYQQELAKRREHLTRTKGWDTLIGCRDCWKSPTAATPAR